MIAWFIINSILS